MRWLKILHGTLEGKRLDKVHEVEGILNYMISTPSIGYNHKGKTQIRRFLLAFPFMLLKVHPYTQTFEINGHEASV